MLACLTRREDRVKDRVSTDPGKRIVLSRFRRRSLMQLQVPWLKPAAWGVVVGAAGSMIIGFSWLGWTLGSTAERMGGGARKAQSVAPAAAPTSAGAIRES